MSRSGRRPTQLWIVLVLTCATVAGDCLAPLTPLTAVSPVAGTIQRRDPTSHDRDGDGLDDGLEDSLARVFAPTLVMSRDEPNWPTSVDVFLSQTTLRWRDDRCGRDTLLVAHPSQLDLMRDAPPTCADDRHRSSTTTRDRTRQTTFYLTDLSSSGRRGDADADHWVIYTHVYPNTVCGVAGRCGVTIQYWQFYPFNSGTLFGWGIGPGDHGGDWEATHVVLDGQLRPIRARFLGHRSIDSLPWEELEVTGLHLRVAVARGEHTNRPNGGRDVVVSTWEHGRLVNLGEKLNPLAGLFLQYAGLWGSPGQWTSGYWGPAFNETSEGRGHFIAAWCIDAVVPGVEAIPSSKPQECYSDGE